jgi:hypothetical protein
MKKTPLDTSDSLLPPSKLPMDLTKEDGVGDSPEGPLKQPGESCLKPAKNQNETPFT